MSDSVLGGIQETMRITFGNSAMVVDLNTTAEDVDGWDSLAHARLIIALERRFEVNLPDGNLFALTNVGELAELIEVCRMRAAPLTDPQESKQ